MVNLKLRPRPWRRGKGAAVAYTLQALSIEAGPGRKYMVPRCEFKVKLAQAYVLGERGTTASYSHDKPAAKRGKMTEKPRVDVGI